MWGKPNEGSDGLIAGWLNIHCLYPFSYFILLPLPPPLLSYHIELLSIHTNGTDSLLLSTFQLVLFASNTLELARFVIKTKKKTKFLCTNVWQTLVVVANYWRLVLTRKKLIAVKGITIYNLHQLVLTSVLFLFCLLFPLSASLIVHHCGLITQRGILSQQ